MEYRYHSTVVYLLGQLYCMREGGGRRGKQFLCFSTDTFKKDYIITQEV
jgi:hypothetical protein